MANKGGVRLGRTIITKASTSINGGNIFLHPPTILYFCNPTFNSSLFHTHTADEQNPNLFLKSVRHQCRHGFRKVDDAVSLFHQMTRMNPLPPLADFNFILCSMIKVKPRKPFNYSTVLSLSSQLQLLGVSYDDYSFSILVNFYCYLGRVDFGFSVIGRMIKLGYQPNIVTFTTLVNGLIHTGLVDEAVRLLDKIVKLGFQPNIVTYGALIKGLCGVGNYANCLSLLVTMHSGFSLCKPNVVIYTTIIDSLCKDKLLPQAVNLFMDMKSKGTPPDVSTYCYFDSRDVQSATMEGCKDDVE